MRLDRAVTLLAFRALGSFVSRWATVRLPVLMYHSVSPSGEHAQPYYQTSTHPQTFAEQMQVLEAAGYTGVTLSEGLQQIRFPSLYRESRHPVALTFDDGYRDFLTAAVPVLKRHSFKATMYL